MHVHFSFHIINSSHHFLLITVFYTFLATCYMISLTTMTLNSKISLITNMYNFIEDAFIIFIETVQNMCEVSICLWEMLCCKLYCFKMENLYLINNKNITLHLKITSSLLSRWYFYVIFSELISPDNYLNLVYVAIVK